MMSVEAGLELDVAGAAVDVPTAGAGAGAVCARAKDAASQHSGKRKRLMAKVGMTRGIR
jgi:hypothetical protein